MFKRVERKRKRKDEEEALGLDEDAKEILGLNDTDSDESESSSNASADERDDPHQFGEDAGDGDGGDSEQEEHAAESDGIEEDEDSPLALPSISLAQALRDPIFTITSDPHVCGCVVCPGKMLKGDQINMVDAHKSSNAHKRRFKQLSTKAEKEDQDSSAWSVLNAVFPEPDPNDGQMSKRRAKRKARQEFLKKRRIQRKAIAAKRKSQAETETSVKEKNQDKNSSNRPANTTRTIPKKRGTKDPSLVPETQVIKKGAADEKRKRKKVKRSKEADA